MSIPSKVLLYEYALDGQILTIEGRNVHVNAMFSPPKRPLINQIYMKNEVKCLCDLSDENKALVEDLNNFSCQIVQTTIF